MAGGVLCVGAVMADVMCEVPRIPKSGEGITVHSTSTTLGGCAFNSANAARQLGADVKLLAPVGRGVYASFIDAELRARNFEPFCVDTTLDCGACTCLVEPGGERTMITQSGIERAFEPAWFERVDADAFACALASGCEIAGAQGQVIVEFFEAHPALEFFYAPGPYLMTISPELHARINALAPVWHLNDMEACQITGAPTPEAAGVQIARECHNACVVTCGGAGAAVYFADGTHTFVPSTPVHATNTVGAGDTHLGALCAARAAGLSWEHSLKIANACAAGVCQCAGGSMTDAEFAALVAPQIAAFGKI